MFGYGGNNPVNNTDPLGLCKDNPGGWPCGGAGAGAAGGGLGGRNKVYTLSSLSFEFGVAATISGLSGNPGLAAVFTIASLSFAAAALIAAYPSIIHGGDNGC